MSSIRLSETHGVNPAIPKCFLCLEDKNEIILAGRLPNDQEAPRGAVWDQNPCDKCQEYMRQGVILISVSDSSPPPDNEIHYDARGRPYRNPYNPFRTGGWCVVIDDFISRCVNPPEFAASILKTRYAFVPNQAWRMLGLPNDNLVAE